MKGLSKGAFKIYSKCCVLPPFLVDDANKVSAIFPVSEVDKRVVIPGKNATAFAIEVS